MPSPFKILGAKPVRVFVLLIVLLLPVCGGLVPPAASQAAPPVPQQPPPPEDEERIRMEKDMAKKANQQRQADLKRDTDKLLKLATELKQYVDKSNENVLSMDVIKKAEEIEKLARSVKEKMKGT
jgi:hypothetical protein